MQQKELCRFETISFFVEKIKQEAIEYFLLTFENAMDFIEKYYDSLLPYDIIIYQTQKYFLHDKGVVLFKQDYEKALKCVYKELVEEILNKLVDEGTLELCWDKHNKTFFWREVEEKTSDGRIKKKGRRRL
mgnify:CR=1 FL=1